MRFVLIVGVCLMNWACTGRSDNPVEKSVTPPSAVPETTGGDKAIADAAQTLQGSWYVADWTMGGFKPAKMGPDSSVYTFTRDEYRVVTKGATPQEGTWKITGRNGNVFDIDLTLAAGINKGLTLTGILELEDNDTVRLCVPSYDTNPMVRPQKFESKAKDKHGVFLLKRRK